MLNEMPSVTCGNGKTREHILDPPSLAVGDVGLFSSADEELFLTLLPKSN
jgi:hypothetical protein